VDLPGHPNIVRVPARELAQDSDLGDLLVTQGVGELSVDEISKALNAGVCAANALFTRGLIRSAALHLCGYTRIVEAVTRIENLRLRVCFAKRSIHFAQDDISAFDMGS
jgi:hypothetical protein